MNLPLIKKISTVISGILVCIIAVAVLWVIFAPTPPMSIGGGLPIPAGYTFVDASAWGRFSGTTKWYCQENTSGRIFDCTNGKIGQEYIFPQGYEFIGASAWGEFGPNTTYYCQNQQTLVVYFCTPEIR
jgi:hypothetical protein